MQSNAEKKGSCVEKNDTNWVALVWWWKNENNFQKT
jgi:hypothetical protein